MLPRWKMPANRCQKYRERFENTAQPVVIVRAMANDGNNFLSEQLMALFKWEKTPLDVKKVGAPLSGLIQSRQVSKGLLPAAFCGIFTLFKGISEEFGPWRAEISCVTCKETSCELLITFCNFIERCMQYQGRCLCPLDLINCFTWRR